MSITERDAALYLHARLEKDRSLLDAEMDMALRHARSPSWTSAAGQASSWYLLPRATT